MVFTVVALLVAVLEERRHITARLELLPKWGFGLILGVLLLIVEIYGTDRSLPFIYFQF